MVCAAECAARKWRSFYRRGEVCCEETSRNVVLLTQNRACGANTRFGMRFGMLVNTRFGMLVVSREALKQGSLKRDCLR